MLIISSVDPMLLIEVHNKLSFIQDAVLAIVNLDQSCQFDKSNYYLPKPFQGPIHILF